jgi:hypothetical protein
MKKLLVIEIMMLLQLVPQGVLLCDMPLLPLLLSVLVSSLMCILYICQANTEKTYVFVFFFKLFAV